MTSNSETALGKANEIVTRATEEDKKKNYAEALRLYSSGCEYFMRALKHEIHSERQKETTRKRIDGYSKRVEEVKKLLENKDNASRPSKEVGGGTDSGSDNQPKKLQESSNKAIIVERPNVKRDDIASATSRSKIETIVLEDSLDEMEVDETTESSLEDRLSRKKQPPKASDSKQVAESHAELLKQSVVSKDFDKFITLMRNLDMSSKRETIRDLDASLIIPVLKYISDIFRDEKLRERASYLHDFRLTIDFIALVLQIHSGYLSTIKNPDKQLGDLVEFARTRAANIDKLNQLEGRLTFVCDQMRIRSTPAIFGQQEEEVRFEEDGRKMRGSERKAANEQSHEMDIP